MAAIGVDTHKATLGACAVDPLGTPIAARDRGLQSRFHPEAKAYVTRQIEVDGKTWREAIRALKRRLVRPIIDSCPRAQTSSWRPLDKIGACQS